MSALAFLAAYWLTRFKPAYKKILKEKTAKKCASLIGALNYTKLRNSKNFLLRYVRDQKYVRDQTLLPNITLYLYYQNNHLGRLSNERISNHLSIIY